MQPGGQPQQGGMDPQALIATLKARGQGGQQPGGPPAPGQPPAQPMQGQPPQPGQPPVDEQTKKMAKALITKLVQYL